MVREGTVEEVIDLCLSIPEFKKLYAKEEFSQRLSQKDAMILIAEEKKVVTGFKCGYQGANSDTYYSWMGGVLPKFRKMGIAVQLLKEMEKRTKALGYKFLSFKTLNEHKAMLIFALKYGFEIVEVTASKKDFKPRIWLKKSL